MLYQLQAFKVSWFLCLNFLLVEVFSHLRAIRRHNTYLALILQCIAIILFLLDLTDRMIYFLSLSSKFVTLFYGIRIAQFHLQNKSFCLDLFMIQIINVIFGAILHIMFGAILQVYKCLQRYLTQFSFSLNKTSRVQKSVLQFKLILFSFPASNIHYGFNTGQRNQSKTFTGFN